MDISREEILSAIPAQISRLATIQSGIMNDLIPARSYVLLGLVGILNIWCIVATTGTYMVLWILASLYFYLTYPLLPLLLFPYHHIIKKGGSAIPHDRRQILDWVKHLHIFSEKKTGVRLGIRFFVMSIVPLTAGVVLIYSLSLIFSLLLGSFHTIPYVTMYLITIQCLGILIFYLVVFFLRHHFYVLARSLFGMNRDNWTGYLILGMVSVIFVIIGSLSVVIFLIAILLPGITLGIYVDVANFIEYRTNAWILLLLFSQFIAMQFLQSVLSRKVASDICDDLCIRLKKAEKLLVSIDTNQPHPGDHHIKCQARSVLVESRIHAITRYMMAGLFPTYSIGVNINELLQIRSISELKGMFEKECGE
ncbi:MAG: hypothetical protein V1862_00345 [Methanobacteriota archaeon]